MLAGLGHGAVGGGDDQDSAVHLGSTGDHVLDVVGVAGAVDVSIVTVLGLILDVGDGNGDAALALLGSLVDVLEGGEVSLAALGLGENLGDGGRQRGLAVVDVADGADVNMRLCTLELFLGHKALLLKVVPAGTCLFELSGSPTYIGKPPCYLVAVTGFEPVTPRVWTGCSNQLSYTAVLEPATGLEPVTSSLPTRCSTD